MDLSDCLTDLWDVLRNCDTIYTIVRNDALAQAKIEQYENALRDMEYEDVSAKTRKWSLPMFYRLPLRFEELTYGELADYIRKNIFPELLGEEKKYEKSSRRNHPAD